MQLDCAFVDSHHNDFANRISAGCIYSKEAAKVLELMTDNSVVYTDFQLTKNRLKDANKGGIIFAQIFFGLYFLVILAISIYKWFIFWIEDKKSLTSYPRLSFLAVAILCVLVFASVVGNKKYFQKISK